MVQKSLRENVLLIMGDCEKQVSRAVVFGNIYLEGKLETLSLTTRSLRLSLKASFLDSFRLPLRLGQSPQYIRIYPFDFTNNK